MLSERPGWIVTTVPWTLRGVTAQVVRRVRLPADHSSPGLARAAVRSAVTEAGLTEVLDEALLLTTELTTNAVLHARTDMDIEIAADGDCVTVTVMDFHHGPITHHHWPSRRAVTPRPVDQLDERGRGLLLVDQLATYWGTLHHPDGKGVWFRLERLSVGAARRGGPAPTSPAPVGSAVGGTSAGQPLATDLVPMATATMLTERPAAGITADAASVSAKALDGLVAADRTRVGG